MAVSTQVRQYSKNFIFNLFTAVLLGWFILLGWTLSLWIRLGFEPAYSRLYQLFNQQRTAIIQFNDGSIANRLNSIWRKIPTKYLSETTNALNQTIHNNFFDNQLTKANELNHIINNALQVTKQFWQVVVMTVNVMLIKCVILITAIPLFLLMITAGLIDGLNQRAIRTASLGRESSYVFHQMNRLFKRGLLMLLAIWLAIPISIKPAFVLVPVSIVLSVMVSVTASRFKKYL